jgi:predicted DCC family thiol-disulfide oxidoreductase YuxK
VSIAAFGVLLQISLVMLALAMKQTGAWKDGTGLSKALHHYLFASPTGFGMRDSALLGPLTRVVYYAQWAVPLLLIVPVGRGIARGAAAVLLAVHGLTYGLLTNLGLFGWTVASSAALVISSDTWKAWLTRHDPKRVRTVIYDADCGVCFFLCQLLKRWDSRRHLVFQPNDHRERLLAWDETKRKVVKRELPKEITAELVDDTVVAVRPDGTFSTRATAAAEIFLALPGFGPLGAFLRVPGISAIADALYGVVAKRRTSISIELGLAACGVEPPHADDGPSGYRDAPDGGKQVVSGLVPPARAMRRRITGAAREVLAAVFLLSVFAQTVHQNQLAWPAPKAAWLANISWWSRTMADWSIMTPEPAQEDGYLVVDGFTRGEASIDPLTGREPKLVPDGAFDLGPMWAAYLDQIRREDRKPFEAAFRTYLGKRGPRWPAEANEEKLAGADAYWVTAPVAGDAEPARQRLFRHSRGGRVFGELGAPERPNRRPLGPNDLDKQKVPRLNLPLKTQE